MKSPDNFEYQERLLLQQSWSELAIEDRQLLMTFGIDQEEFLHRQKMLRTARVVFGESLTAPAPGIMLRNALSVRRTERNRNYLLRSAAVVALLIGGFLLGRQSVKNTPRESQPEEIMVEVAVRDTIYLERIIETQLPPEVQYRDRVQYDTVYLPPPIARTALPTNSSPPDGTRLSVTSPETLPDWSRNAKSTEKLLKVLVEVY